jgi:hypothetical protein
MKTDLNTTMTDSGQVSHTWEAISSTKRPGATPFREPQKRSGHPGDHMWSTDENACVWEGTSAESPDMNTVPDAGGGSVSSF